jgi:hypothetical protein
MPEDGLDVDATLHLGPFTLTLAWRTTARTVALVGRRAPESRRRCACSPASSAARSATCGSTARRGKTGPCSYRRTCAAWDGCRRTAGCSPHLSVRENLAYTRAPDAEVRTMADRLGVGALLERRPRHLSGGERQRVALGPRAPRPTAPPAARRAVCGTRRRAAHPPRVRRGGAHPRAFAAGRGRVPPRRGRGGARGRAVDDRSRHDRARVRRA